ncbi:hypothetical protein GGX14DRAFT_401003 [Mycena pura]|uniref:Uncharacterized protein n=1 Tax=Mycena pura TaxID=153505 RepID=A0AAD6V4Z5_9AGAR|nr:hypothetical protein GGX14DRAFT_401003 [Mycena pura]
MTTVERDAVPNRAPIGKSILKTTASSLESILKTDSWGIRCHCNMTNVRLTVFDGCSNFAITGSTFNIWYNPSPSAPDEGATLVINGHQYNDPAPEFRSIRLGDIHLLSYVGERKIVEYHAVRRKKHTGTVRVVTGRTKVHHARIFPSQDVFTVVEYEGCNFARWKTEAEERQLLRHPHMAQLFGTTSSRSMNALIYHDELLPINEALSKCTSHLSRKCLKYLLSSQYWSFVHYWYIRSGEWLDVQNYANHADWFRASTGQLCIELGANSGSYQFPLALNNPSRSSIVGIPTVRSSMSNAELVNMMNLTDLLDIFCYLYCIRKT